MNWSDFLTGDIGAFVAIFVKQFPFVPNANVPRFNVASLGGRGLLLVAHDESLVLTRDASYVVNVNGQI